MVPRCQKCNADRRKVIIVRNGVGHVTDLELDVSGALSQCPSGDPAQQVKILSHVVRTNPGPGLETGRLPKKNRLIFSKFPI